MSDELRAALHRDRYPRSSSYDPALALDAWAGPNSLWSTESIAEHLALEPGMKVLDLGCGAGASSVFLAREFDVTVWSVDLHFTPDDIWQRAKAFGVEDKVFPQRGDARELPFPTGFFDAVVSIGAYMYFGTDDMFVFQHLNSLKAGGRVGVVMAGLSVELDRPPDDLLPLWFPAFPCLHSPEWWRRHLERSNLVDVDLADIMPNGWADWADWNDIVCGYHDHASAMIGPETDALRADAGQRFDLVRVVFRKR